MIDHALTAGDVKTKSDYATLYYLREALNKRLGTSLHDMESMQKHLRNMPRETKDAR
jgi:hypothetical protein